MAAKHASQREEQRASEALVRAASLALSCCCCFLWTSTLRERAPVAMCQFNRMAPLIDLINTALVMELHALGWVCIFSLCLPSLQGWEACNGPCKENRMEDRFPQRGDLFTALLAHNGGADKIASGDERAHALGERVSDGARNLQFRMTSVFSSDVLSVNCKLHWESSEVASVSQSHDTLFIWAMNSNYIFLVLLIIS